MRRYDTRQNRRGTIMEEWLTYRQLAKLLGSSVSDAKAWLSKHAGRIKFTTYGRREPAFSGSDVRSLLAGNLFEKGAR